MKRTLITTVLTVSLVTGFGISTVPAANLDLAGPSGASQEQEEVRQDQDEATPVADSGSELTQLIARGRGGFRGGGGFRRGGGGFRRSGGGMRRAGGYRSGGARRTSGVRRSGGMRRSNAGHTQTRHASNGRSSHAGNGRSSNRGGRGNNSNGRNHSGRNGGNRGGWGGGGGWGGWGGGLVPVDVYPYVPDVVPVVVPDVTPAVDPQPAVVTLMNPAETGGTVSYSLGAGQYALKAGQSVDYSQGTQVIAFNRGGSFGEARYTLEPGTYRFVVTDHGLDLHSVTNEQVAADTHLPNDHELMTWLNGR